LEIARLLLGVLVATALPASVPFLRKRRFAALLFSSAFCWYAVLPVLDDWAASFVWVATIAVSQVYTHLRRRSAGEASRYTFQLLVRELGWTIKPAAVAGLALLPIAIAWIAFHGSQSVHALADSVGQDRVAVTVSGLLLAIFVSNDLAYLAIRPYLSRLRNTNGTHGSIVPSGIYVGWVERAVIFSFVAGGQADAAALAVAAKALIRLPEVQEQDKGSIMGEYIIVGTLASVLASIAAAVFVRLALGLSAL
jgi:hypothetical protein